MGRATTNMVRSRSLLLLIAALASTLVAAEVADWKRGLDAIVTKLQTNDDDATAPVEDANTIVPENPDPEVADESPSKLAVIEVNTMLLQGEPKGACKKLADELCNEVEQSVQSFQKSIQALPDGSDCEAKGQNEVEQNRQKVVSTETNYKVATQQAEEAAKANVDFGVYILSSLDGSVCGQLWKDSAYIAAKETARIAAERATEARFAFTTATEQYEESLHRAAEKRWKCQCAVRRSYNLSYRTATKDKNEEANAYKKCNHMKCYLENTPADQCTFTIPTVQERQFPDYGVPENECQGTYLDRTVTTKEIQTTVVDTVSSITLPTDALNTFFALLDDNERAYFKGNTLSRDDNIISTFEPATESCPLGLMQQPNCGAGVKAIKTKGKRLNNGVQCYVYNCTPPPANRISVNGRNIVPKRSQDDVLAREWRKVT